MNISEVKSSEVEATEKPSGDDRKEEKMEEDDDELDLTEDKRETTEEMTEEKKVLVHETTWLHNTDVSMSDCRSKGHRFESQGPVVQSIVSLTSSLRVISLTVLADSVYNILIFFAEKMWVAFALQKLLTFFQQKISEYLRISWCKF